MKIAKYKKFLSCCVTFHLALAGVVCCCFDDAVAEVVQTAPAADHSCCPSAAEQETPKADAHDMEECACQISLDALKAQKADVIYPFEYVFIGLTTAFTVYNLSPPNNQVLNDVPPRFLAKHIPIYIENCVYRL